MDKAGSTDCYLYISNGTDYAILDHNGTDINYLSHSLLLLIQLAMVEQIHVLEMARGSGCGK
ncbi:hypothetical protein D4R99_01805 [bacterium]|nr:MAG: hypothetical protein D4R99_01805 [bacterium]